METVPCFRPNNEPSDPFRINFALFELGKDASGDQLCDQTCPIIHVGEAKRLLECRDDDLDFVGVKSATI